MAKTAEQQAQSWLAAAKKLLDRDFSKPTPKKPALKLEIKQAPKKPQTQQQAVAALQKVAKAEQLKKRAQANFAHKYGIQGTPSEEAILAKAKSNAKLINKTLEQLEKAGVSYTSPYYQAAVKQFEQNGALDIRYTDKGLRVRTDFRSKAVQARALDILKLQQAILNKVPSGSTVLQQAKDIEQRRRAGIKRIVGDEYSDMVDKASLVEVDDIYKEAREAGLIDHFNSHGYVASNLPDLMHKNKTQVQNFFDGISQINAARGKDIEQSIVSEFSKMDPNDFAKVISSPSNMKDYFSTVLRVRF